jgi:hypothetical protein
MPRFERMSRKHSSLTVAARNKIFSNTLYVLTRIPKTKLIRKMTRKMKNRIFAIPVAAPAIPANPNTPAIIAMIKKINAHCNMMILLESEGRREFGRIRASLPDDS